MSDAVEIVELRPADLLAEGFHARLNAAALAHAPKVLLVRNDGYAGETPEWCDALWTKLLEDEELYGELLYYMKNNTLLDRMRREGCTLTDLFARQMDQSGGKAGGYGQEDHCRMVDMVLRAFADMARRNREGK